VASSLSLHDALPIYQAFSRREVTISLLDARAGSPPSAAQVLLRLAQARNLAVVDPFLEQWERWAAEVLESHLSFPVLSYYRSQRSEEHTSELQSRGH